MITITVTATLVNAKVAVLSDARARARARIERLRQLIAAALFLSRFAASLLPYSVALRFICTDVHVRSPANSNSMRPFIFFSVILAAFSRRTMIALFVVGAIFKGADAHCANIRACMYTEHYRSALYRVQLLSRVYVIITYRAYHRNIDLFIGRSIHDDGDIKFCARIT